jgi:hypothetical protein
MVRVSGSSRERDATSRARRWVRRRGISIFTGHTSPHAPQRDDAYGSEPASPSTPSSWGVRIAPIGPG